MASKDLKWRLLAVVFVVACGVVALLPNFVHVGEGWWFSKDKIKYGLDIQGGLHLVMGVDVKGVTRDKLLRSASTFKEELKKDGVDITNYTVEALPEYQQLVLTFDSQNEIDKAVQYISKNFYYMQELERTKNTLTYRFIDSYVRDVQKNTIEQAIETIRNRIDEFGVAEPSITAQGDDRILVQLPGLKEASKAKDLINRTARLDFMIVSEEHTQQELATWIQDVEKAENFSLKTLKYSEYVQRVNEALRNKLPANTKILFEKAQNTENMEMGKVPYLLQSDTNLGGDSIKDAFVTPGEFNEPEVALNFNPDGAHKFGELTGANVNRRMAIVLDDVIYSAPNIKQKISGGSARITLGGGRDYNASLEEAKMISMALRAGALPARLEQLEERTVGPSLGADSIAKGQKAAIVGALIVFLFMLVYYKAFGVIADVALFLNIMLVYGVLTALEATLTLPGIAGIALTIGMAVDANIIINERIKDELRKGASIAGAIREGYAKAFSAIIDSNITTAATSVILMYFGTGPVRGFAVTLLIGIITTLFTAFFTTHVFLDVLVGKMKLKKLAI